LAKDAGVSDICGIRVNLTANPNDGNDVSFEIYLPSPTKWNRRFLTVGNGGFNGGTSRLDMLTRSVHGWAVMSTNTGHEEQGMGWAVRGEEVQKDWAWRAMSRSLPFAKAVVAAYYGNVKTVANYYSGCSTGGRMGIRQIQEDPNSFDGMLIGAPAWNVKSAMPVLSRVGWLGEKFGLNPTFDPNLFVRISDRVYRECNVIGQDKSADDGVVRDSAACLEHFLQSGIRGPVWDGLDCTVDNPNCVSFSQREAFLTIAQEFKRPPSNQSYAGDGFDITAPVDFSVFLLQPNLMGFDQDFSRYMLGQELIWDNDTNGALLIDKSNAWDTRVRANADPSVLNGWKGKVILYTGTADGYVSTEGTRRAFALAGGNDNPNLKFFELPGMPHCVDLGTGGKQPPWYIGGVANYLKSPTNSRWHMPNNTNPPLNTPEHDALNALTAWVEGQSRRPPTSAPTQFTSTAFANWPNLTISKQRPICASPLRQEWDGKGDVNRKESWSCVPSS